MTRISPHALRLAAALLIVPAALAAQVRIEAAPTALPKTETWGWDRLLQVIPPEARRTPPAPQQVSPRDADAAAVRYDQCITANARGNYYACETPPLGRCTITIEGPDSLALAAPYASGLSHVIAWAGPRRGWRSVPIPTATDTLRVRFADAYCYNANLRGDHRNQVAYYVVEHDGAYLGIPSYLFLNLPGQSEYGRSRKPVLAMDSTGAIEPALLLRECDAGVCTQRVTTATGELRRMEEKVIKDPSLIVGELTRRGYSQYFAESVIAGQVQIRSWCG